MFLVDLLHISPKKNVFHRVLQESLYGYHTSSLSTVPASTNHTQNVSSTIDTNAPQLPDAISIDSDLQMALQISIREQEARQEEILREQQMLEEVLRLSLEEK